MKCFIFVTKKNQSSDCMETSFQPQSTLSLAANGEHSVANKLIPPPHSAKVTRCPACHVAPPAQATVSELKERVRAQYQRMHALLEADQAETAQMLGDALAACVRKTAQPALLLKEKRREAEKLRRSLQALLQRSGGLNFMKVSRAEQPCGTLLSGVLFVCLLFPNTELHPIVFFLEHKIPSAANEQVSTTMSPM